MQFPTMPTYVGHTLESFFGVSLQTYSAIVTTIWNGDQALVSRGGCYWMQNYDNL